MVNKVEFFKAVDKIDGAPSFFAIQSIDGEDMAYNVIKEKTRSVNELIMLVVKFGKCGWLDSSLEPRRRDMVDPVLLYTLVIEGGSK
jgi:hypothetical protein